MLKHSPTQISQSAFCPEQEADIERQLAFTNGYIRQYAYFEERYTGEQILGTYLEGIEELTGEPKKLPNLTNVSVRLHDELLDLHTWKVLDFHRSLSPESATLSRRCTVRSPKGHTLRVESKRTLLREQKECIQIEYRVESIDYDGPISVLSLIGDGRYSDSDWYPLDIHVAEDMKYFWLRSKSTKQEICAAAKHMVYKNGVKRIESPILIEKKNVIGYAVTDSIHPGEWLLVRKCVVVTDSRHHPSDQLIEKTIQQIQAINL